tara:strand:- start:224 stop:1882 length:1659 start_codon:yes stop_codon:yes gene_type:complete
MGILRTDIISHSQLEGSGSVEFDGDGDSLTFDTSSGLSLDGDFTIEFYIFNNTIALDTQHPSPITMPSESGHLSQIYTNSSNDYYGLYKQSDIVTTGNNSALTGVWQHVAFTRKGSTCHAFLDGVLKNTASSTVTFGGTSGTYRIGSYNGSGGDVNGFISNLRIIKGNALYTVNFTVPKFELKNIPGTILLGCQSTTSATDFAVTPSTITANNDAVASSFHSGLKKDVTDTGVVFDGVTIFDSQAFMVPPSGKTSERNRGRGVIAGGTTPTHSSIDFFNIQSQGNSIKFGSLQSGDIFANQMCSSSIRGISGGGASPTIRNFLDFITIATESDSTDFGDLTVARRDVGALSNQTRGIWTGGSTPSKSDVIDFVTIATIGNATDFGNLTAAMNGVSSTSSPTRGIMGGGTDPSATINTIQFITIASTGNASDFGDLTRTASSLGAVSSGTRGVFANGGSNTIDFITIASAGNASDFGDSTLLRAQCTATMSNSIRGVFAGGYQPSPNSTDTNIVDFIEIATTGNATDFGDISRDTNDGNRENGGCSDSHGGLT